MAVTKALTPEVDGDDELQPMDMGEMDLPPATTEEGEDGSITVTFGEDEAPRPEDAPFDANLAEYMDEDALTRLGHDLVEAYEQDRSTRTDWEKAYTEGLDLLGIKPQDKDKPWPGACGVYHPILAEAVVRFQSQTIMEIFPASGPCKTKIVGAITPQRTKTAGRMAEEMNYQLTEKISDYRAETERMLFSLPLAGSAFKKVYFDPTLSRACAVFVPAEDFVAPYGATDLLSCPRYTHVMRSYPNDIRKLQVAGFYRDVDLAEPVPEYSDAEEKQAKLGGTRISAEADDRHTLLEMHVEIDLEGFEDPDGIALPYVVTIDKQTAMVLSIYRNWREDDKQRRKRLHFVKYDYVPGFGFYAFGLLHLMGGLAKSASSLLQQLVDAGTLSNLPAGLKSRGLRIKGDDTPIMPGEFRDVDVPGGAIKENITFLPYKEPSAVLYQLMGNIVEEGRRIGSVADLQIGDSNQEAPVGTTLALLERAMKVMSAVQARLHASLKQELRLIAQVIHDNLPEQYDYAVDPANALRREDFDLENVDIVPVSDPNASSMAQRVVQYQAALQLAAQAPPNTYNIPLLHRQMLEVLGIRDPDKIVALPDEQKPQDAVTENMNILMGKPVKSFMWQDHEAHIAIHMAAAQDPKLTKLVGQSPQAPVIMGALQAHVAEHVAYAYRAQIEQQLGTALPAPDQELPPEVEVQLSKVTADAARRLLGKDQAEAQAQQIAQQQQDPVIQAQQKELELKQQEIIQKGQIETQRLQLELKKIESNVAMELARLQSEERRAGLQVSAKAMKDAADLELRRDEMGSREKTAGAQLGVKVAETHHRSRQDQQRADADRVERARDRQAKQAPPQGAE